MIGLVLVGRGQFGQGLISAMEEAIGPQPLVSAISIIEKGPIEAQRQMIRDIVASTDQGDGVLLLADDLDGSASNLAGSLLAEGVAAMVAGVNLPMLLHLVHARRKRDFTGDAVALARDAQKAGRQAVLMTVGGQKPPNQNS
jgi:mannose/fructose-specific phosphotransferase system component IIA